MKILKELIPYLIIIIVVILVRTFIATPVIVDGPSMNKNLNDNDLVIVCKVCEVKRDSIVVLRELDDNEKIIKRIIGMPGETIEITNGVIYINDKRYNDIYSYGETSDYQKVTLKDDEYFILGDNRLISKDSRYFGPIKAESIIGTAVYRLYPFTKIGSI